MYVFGIAGIIIAAVITRKKVAVNSVTTTVYTFVSVFILYGGLMNLAAMFMSSSYQNGDISISLGKPEAFCIITGNSLRCHACAWCGCLCVSVWQYNLYRR